MSEIVHGYKGFSKDMTAHGGFQYKEGERYEQDAPAALCGQGFHYVTQPIHVFQYFPPATSVYHLVEARDSTGPAEGGDSKEAARVIEIGAKIELPVLIKAQIDFVFKNVKKSKAKSKNTTEPCAIATNSGYCGASTNSGDGGVAVNVGVDGKARSSLGGWIAAMEHDENGVPIDFKAFKVDGKKIKADVFYTLRNGKAVEA